MTQSVQELQQQLAEAEAKANTNGANMQLKDNTEHLEFDPKQIEAWELAVLESGRITETMMLFARFLCNGNGLISPGLPMTPFDEMSDDDKQEIYKSDAYKLVKHYKTDKIKSAVQSFMRQYNAGF